MTKKKIFSSKKRRKIIIISLITLLYLAFLGVTIFVARRVAQADQEKKINCRPENLAKLIKTELIEEREKIKNGQEIRTRDRNWIYSIDDDNSFIWVSENVEKNTGKWKVGKTELTKKGWNEIVELYCQNEYLKLDKSLGKEEKKVKEKLKNSANPQLFYLWNRGDFSSKEWLFWGWSKEKKYILFLTISKKHPDLIKFSLKEGYCLIEGIENVPYLKDGLFLPEKEVKLADKITIKPC